MRRLPFFLLLLLSAVMAAATLLEKQAGSAAVSEAVYHSGWFILLWTALLLFSLPLLLGRTGRQQLRLPGLLLHGAFGLILIGALLTHLTSLSGILHLRRGVPENSFRSTHTRLWERDKADSRERLTPGERVSVFIKSIRPERMKIKLQVIDRLPPAEPGPLPYQVTDGTLERWTYSPPGCEKTVETVFTETP